MPNLNKTMLMGRLVRDPELRMTPKGTAICQFGLAVNREWKTESGEKQSEVLFVDVEAWGRAGETIAKYLTKGQSLYVEGRLKLDQWEDKTTKEKRSRIKVVLESFQFIDSKGSSEAPSQAPAAAPASAPASKLAERQGELDDDSIPF